MLCGWQGISWDATPDPGAQYSPENVKQSIRGNKFDAADLEKVSSGRSK
jgi:hypothetical protein